MSVFDLLSRLREANVRLWLDGDRLRFSAPRGAFGPELRAELQEHRDEVIELLRRTEETAGPGVVPVVADAYPLSLAQRRMWFFEQVRPGTSTYHMAASWNLRGDLRVDALRRGFEAIVERHVALRTRFTVDGEEPVQLVLPGAEVPLPVIDLSGLSAPERDAELDRLASAEATRPFDLTRTPLLRTTAVRVRPDEHVLLLTMHHLVSDMWSADVLGRELTAFYGALSGAGPAAALPPLDVQYPDFAVWQRAQLDTGPLRTGLDYWTRQLAGAPAVLDLPTDHPRPADGSFAAGQQSVRLPADLVADVDALCRRAGATRFMVLLSAFAMLLSRYTHEKDILVGSPIANRTRPEVQDLIGLFVNMLVLRADLHGDPTFLDLVGRVRDTTLGAYEHQDVPVEQIVEALRPRRDPGRPPLFQVLFIMQNVSAAPFELPGLTVAARPIERSATEFDLTLEIAEDGAGLTASVHYNSDIFAAPSMRRLLGHWQTLLAGAVHQPERRIAALPLLTAAEVDLMTGDWNSTGRDYPRQGVHELFAAQAARTPSATAVAFRDTELTYAELDASAVALAGRLQAAGVGPGALVAVCVPRSADMLVSLLAVLRTGAAYLPIDTTLPPQRLAYMLEDAAPRAILTTRGQQLPAHTIPVVALDEPEPAAAPLRPVPVTGDDLAYVIYTSGSTGRPKGVMVEHRGLSNFLAAMDDVLRPRDDEGVWLAVTSVSFDIAVLEVFWPLLRGWKVVLQDDGDILPGGGAHRGEAARPLDFSLFYFAASDAGDNHDDAYRLLLEGAKFADRNGFSGVWMPERHLDTFGGPYPNPAVTAAALATITERVQLRAGSVVLPLHNPIRVAEEWSVVDKLSGGRVSLSFASGWHADDFALAPDPSVYERRREVLVEQVDTVRRLWRGESIEVRNGVGRQVRVSTHPRPVQPELPVWLTAAGNPETFRSAGANGAFLLTHLLGQSVEELAEKIEVYRAAWRATGRPGDGHVALMVHTFVGDDAAEVRETVRGPFREYLRSSFGLVRALAPSLGYDGELTEEDVETLLDHAFGRYYDVAGLMGTVEQCTDMAARLSRAGVDEVACLIDFGVGIDAVLASLPKLDQLRATFERTSAAGPAAPAAGYAVAAQIDRHAVTHLQCTPSLAGILLADPPTRESLRAVGTLVVGGEALPGTLAADLVTTARRQAVNMYGPTETTIWSTSWPVTDPDRGVRIGRPMANTAVYVLDEELNLVPPGVAGELYLAGDGVARGYLNRPGLTADRFRPSPFVDGARMYRTGDRVRYRADGELEFLGRVDRQIKLGGHRIELGEIESVLLQQPAIRQAAVVLLDGEFPRLVAYLVGTPMSPADLRAAMLRTVPEAMVPGLLVWLDELPLNPSGKVDYRRLPDPQEAAAGDRSVRAAVTHREYVAPRDELERSIAKIWQDVLRVDEVGMLDSFFDLGGHSLMAIQMVSRMRAALGRDVGLRVVFESATVAELAEKLRDSGPPSARAGIPPLRPVERTGPLPLSFAQQRMWFFDQMNPGVSAYHLSSALRLDGGLRPDALHHAFAEIVRRHEVLRTVFAVVGGAPAQVVTPRHSLPLPVVDLSGLPAAEREAAVDRLALDESRLPFDLERDALLRTTLLRLGDESHVLLITTHHIVSDSWSIGVLVRELGILYDAYVAGRPSPLPPLAVQYADFAAWQQDWLQGPVLEEQLAYWRDSLEGAPAVMELPYDRPVPALPTYRGAQADFRLDAELSQGLKALSREQDVTIFVTLLAAFTALLHRWAAQDHVVVGVPVAGRDVTELEPLIGFFANTTVVHVDVEGEPTFTELLHRVRRVVMGAYEHQDLPVEKLVADLNLERDLTRNPLFQTMFVYINDLVMEPTLGDLRVTPMQLHHGAVFMDLNMAMQDGPDGLQGIVDYSTDLFDRDTVDWLLDSFRELLVAVRADPGLPVARLPLTPPRPKAITPVAVAASDVPPESAVSSSDVPLEMVVSATFTAGPVEQYVAFWADELGRDVEVKVGPYGQLFQTLLDPASAMAANGDGLNVALVRLTDWAGADGTGPEQVAEEFVEALAEFLPRSRAPFLVCLCPDPRPVPGTGRWRELLEGLDGVVVLDLERMLDLYGIEDYHDPVSDQAGRIPYTAEFFAMLGTCLARQASALVVGNPPVVFLDGDGWAGLAEPVRHTLHLAALALARQGRRVVVGTTTGAPPPGFAARDGIEVLTDSRPPAEKLAAVGVPLSDCLYLGGDEKQCAAVLEACPDAAVLQYPSDGTDLAEFLEHTWLLDPSRGPVPGVQWWMQEER